MAPIPSREAVVMQPQSSLVCFKAAKLEAQPSVAIGNSRIKRCSSVSSEEEESLLVGRTDRSSLFAMSMSMSIKKTRTFAGMFTVCNTNSATGTLNTAWPGVMSGLEEDERPVKVKEKCPLEPEEKKLAVENDDDSSNSSSTSESSLFELDEKYLSLNLWTGPQIPSKSVKCGKCLLIQRNCFCFGFLSKGFLYIQKRVGVTYCDFCTLNTRTHFLS